MDTALSLQRNLHLAWENCVSPHVLIDVTKGNCCVWKMCIKKNKNNEVVCANIYIIIDFYIMLTLTVLAFLTVILAIIS